MVILQKIRKKTIISEDFLNLKKGWDIEEFQLE